MNQLIKFIVLGSLWCLCAFPIHAQLIFSDDFNYTVNKPLPGQWKSQCTGNDLLAVSPSLIYNGYSSGIGNAANLLDGKEYFNATNFPSQAGPFYLGFLFSAQSVAA